MQPSLSLALREGSLGLGAGHPITVLKACEPDGSHSLFFSVGLHLAQHFLRGSGKCILSSSLWVGTGLTYFASFVSHGSPLRGGHIATYCIEEKTEAGTG